MKKCDLRRCERSVAQYCLLFVIFLSALARAWQSSDSEASVKDVAGAWYGNQVTNSHETVAPLVTSTKWVITDAGSDS